MAVEKNNEVVEEEIQEQPQGLPIYVSIEGEEEVIEERPQDDFNANLAEKQDPLKYHCQILNCRIKK